MMSNKNDKKKGGFLNADPTLVSKVLDQVKTESKKVQKVEKVEKKIIEETKAKVETPVIEAAQ
jgi:hypothetical protein